MSLYWHQQVFSTGAWWGFEEVEPGLYRRTYMVADLHYFHPVEIGGDACMKCDRGYHSDPQPATARHEPPPATEQEVLLGVFMEMLRAPTGDGKRKRHAGTKPPWWRDGSHMAAVWSHFRKRALGELVDPDSGAHPYVHAAWRLLSVAYQETYGMRDPAGRGGTLQAMRMGGGKLTDECADCQSVNRLMMDGTRCDLHAA